MKQGCVRREVVTGEGLLHEVDGRAEMGPAEQQRGHSSLLHLCPEGGTANLLPRKVYVCGGGGGTGGNKRV